MGVNKVILLGRLGKDPETRVLDNGTSVASFSLATSESYKDRTTGERKELTEWHNCIAWRGLADIVGKYLKKGSQVYIEGKIQTKKWEKDGVTRYTTQIVVDNMQMIGDKPQERVNEHHPDSNDYHPSDDSSDDLPF